MTRKFYTEVVRDETNNTWEVHYYQALLEHLQDVEICNHVPFTYEGHARLESSLYDIFYNTGMIEGSNENDRVDIWEEIIQIMEERGMVV